MCLYALSRYDEAENLLSEVLDVQMRVLGSRQPDIIETMKLVGRLCAMLGRHEKAENLASNALTQSSILLGRKHPCTLHCMELLAKIYLYVGQIRPAVDIGERGWSIANETLEPENEYALDLRVTLAESYLAQGDVERAMQMLEEGWEIRKATLGCEHPNILTTLASVWIQLGVEDKGRRLLQATVDTQIRVLGPDHQDTLETRQILQDPPRQRGHHGKFQIYAFPHANINIDFHHNDRALG